MPLDLPTLAETRGLARDFLSARLGGASAVPANSRARVLSDAMAALAFGGYQYIDRLALMFLPDTAEGIWLDRWANIFLTGRQPATFASGAAVVTGSAGTVLPVATQLTAGGVLLETTAEVTVGSVATEVPVRATRAGAAGNLAADTPLSLVTGVSGVDGSAAVASLYGGIDSESDDSLRGRVLARIQRPPMGGDADDYVTWAREVPGVTRAWCAPTEQGVGSVTVRFMMDEVRAVGGGFPLAEDVSAVLTHISPKRPVGFRDLYVAAPVPEPIDFTVSSLSRDSVSTRAAIASSVSAMLRSRAAPARSVNGALVPAQTIYAAWVAEAAMQAPGVEHFDLGMTDHVMPYSGNLAVLGTITFP